MQTVFFANKLHQFLEGPKKSGTEVEDFSRDGRQP